MLLKALQTPLVELQSMALQPVTVAVLDSGVDATHPDLVGRVIEAYRVELVDHAPTFVDVGNTSNNDGYGHGTAVASIICKIAPNARIVDLRVLGGNHIGAGAALLAGLKSAVLAKHPIINMSLAATAEFAQRLHALCEVAYRQGQSVVAARRNMPLSDNGFPAELSSVISVDQTKMPSLFTVFYRRSHPIEYVGHGEDVEVAALGGGYTIKTGTSFATPAISGLCALLLGAYPGLRPFEVKALLKALATDPEAV